MSDEHDEHTDNEVECAKLGCANRHVPSKNYQGTTSRCPEHRGPRGKHRNTRYGANTDWFLFGPDNSRDSDW
ncbi:hypothetical protein LCGC14_2407040 [marine sediment metagenome]|uniref:Uncharacterized protein n=1 Tax=marine sediment metagenome TaxID=412755 RepID=A0A0F9E5Y3_9ZZZZ